MNRVRILVVRNDKLGDFMLAWPALALIKRSMPHAHISVLVPPYTQSLAALCPWLDAVLSDPADLPQVHHDRFDAVLTLFSTGRIGWQVFKGRIPLRVAPATKWAQWLYNVRVVQRRSRSEKPEYVYNLDLAEVLLQRLRVQPVVSKAPYWPVSVQTVALERERLAQKLGLNLHRPWAFVHSGSGGSANNLSVAQYAALVTAINQRRDSRLPAFQWVYTCGPGEEAKAEELSQRCSPLGGVVYRSTDGLAAFAQSLSAAQLVIAGSTGPLHVAGALDVPTVGFFPGKRSSTALRWRPCNSEGRTLGFSPPPSHADQVDMSTIDTTACAYQVVDWYQALAS